MRSAASTLLLLPVALLVSAAPLAQRPIDTDVDLAHCRRVLAASIERLEGVERRFAESLAPTHDDEAWRRALFGYDPPGTAVQMAWLHAFLYSVEGRPEDARAAQDLLARMAAYRDRVPAGLARERIEYADGLPAVPSFFQLADYAEAWARVRSAPGLDPAVGARVDDALAGSAEHVFTFPEWGAHNRAMLRAEGLAWSARALPAHPNAAHWRAMARALADDSIAAWEIEDAALYHPIWLQALLRYGEATGVDVASTPQFRFYMASFAELLAPDGSMPAFGDAWWHSSLERWYVCFEWAAAELGDPELAWAAARVYGALGASDGPPTLSRCVAWARLHHLDRPPPPREPAATARPNGRGGLDDVLAKKVVLRSGHGPDDLYLLLNYRDEGDGGFSAREYLRRTLAVEHEKAHHGNEDENSIVLLMDGGAVLLHDGGYRDRAPSGPHGAYRADVFHQRLVARAGRPVDGESTLEFLLDEGAYDPVETTRVDRLSFELGEYARTRLVDRALGYTADRTLVLLREPRVVVCVDTVRVDRPGDRTFATLWATERVRERGRHFVLGANETLGRDALAPARELLLLFPDGDGRSAGSLRRHGRDEELTAQRRSGSFDAGERLAFVTVLWPVAPGTTPDALGWDLRADAGHDGITVTLARSDEQVTVGIAADLDRGLVAENVRPRYEPAAGRAAYGDIQTDADLVLVHRRGQRARWAASNMTFVAVGDALAFEARRLQLFQPTGRSDRVGRTKWRRWEGDVRPDTREDPLDDEIRAALPRMVELMREGISTREPNTSFARGPKAGDAPEGTPFDGSYDFHSCVAAHWALLVHARTDGDDELAAWALARLDDATLDAHREWLAGLEEMPWLFPYEHAWLALLGGELAKHERPDSDGASLRAFRLFLEERLLEHLETSDFPEDIPPRERGGTGFNGFYKSWLWAYLLLSWSEPIGDGAAERLEVLYRQRIAPLREEIAAHDEVFGFDFLWVPSLLALIDEDGEYDPGELPALPASVKISTVHVVGMELSRVWPGAIASAANLAGRDALRDRYRQVLARGDLWSDDFAVVSHWVPQFLYLGFWLADGRP